MPSTHPSNRIVRCLPLVLIFVSFGLIWFLAAQASVVWSLSDFTVTFYPAARYLLRGESVYLNAYPHPFNGREYPPFAPIWGLLVFLPFATLPLPAAEGLRVALDVISIPFLAFLALRWAHVFPVRRGVWLALAPWLILEIHSGQMTPLVLLGTFLCYWGLRRRSAVITAVGLWLVLIKFTLVALIVLGVLFFAWRQKILGRTLALAIGLAAVSSLATPLWFVDVIRLYVERLAHPRPLDSVLLLPLYPWGQIVCLTIGIFFGLWYARHFQLLQPTPWLWAVLSGASLLSALHTFPYDWLLLMLPLAWLLRAPRGVWFVALPYVYSVLWVIGMLVADHPVIPVAIVPGLTMLLLVGVGVATKGCSG